MKNTKKFNYSPRSVNSVIVQDEDNPMSYEMDGGNVSESYQGHYLRQIGEDGTQKIMNVTDLQGIQDASGESDLEIDAWGTLKVVRKAGSQNILAIADQNGDLLGLKTDSGKWLAYYALPLKLDYTGNQKLQQSVANIIPFVSVAWDADMEATLSITPDDFHRMATMTEDVLVTISDTSGYEWTLVRSLVSSGQVTFVGTIEGQIIVAEFESDGETASGSAKIIDSVQANVALEGGVDYPELDSINIFGTTYVIPTSDRSYVEGLIAPAFSSSDSYSKGALVIHDDKLYSAKQDLAAGAWDSSKWELTSIEGELDKKMSIGGYYGNSGVGYSDVSDNLTPYSDDSGDDQEEPFLMQGTACGNGTEVVDTGSFAQLKEKRGNTLVVNQQYNVTYSNTVFNVTTNIVNGVVSISGTSDSSGNGPVFSWTTFKFPKGHKFIVLKDFDLPQGDYLFDQYNLDAGTNIVGRITTASYDFIILQLHIANANVVYNVSNKHIYIIDLTQWFGSDSAIPVDLISHPEHFFRYYQGSLAYNAGSLENSDGRYLRCLGRNQYDGEHDVKAVPYQDYYIYGSATLTYKDKEGNTISTESKSNETFKTPANCVSVGVSGSGQICISLYYSGESGYDQYYPFVELENVDTGTEVLRSAGSVADVKKPDGTIIRNVGVVDLGTLDWTYDSGSNYSYASIANRKPQFGNIISSNYPYAGEVPISSMPNGTIRGDQTTSVIYIKGVQNPTGYANFELATPTTEQGTAFKESIAIDDFGSMSFSTTNGIPQGNLIFYPVDYKATIDTLYNYVSGDPTVLAKKGELAANDPETLKGEVDARAAQDAILQNAVGGTLRHCLAIQESGLEFDETDYVDLGSLTWTYISANQVFVATLSGRKVGNTTKTLSTKFNCITSGTLASLNNLELSPYYYNTNSDIIVKDTAYTDATVFKAAMKGILLAYEKASS